MFHLNVVEIIYFFSLILSVICAVALLFTLKKSAETLPGGWKNSISFRKFRTGVCFLMLFLLTTLISETASFYHLKHHQYNSYVMSIYFTVSIPFLFGFLFIHTHKTWKKVVYVLFYLILIAYLISGGYYNPKCIHPAETTLLLNGIYFLAALLHLTDLLITPKTDYFDFQLKLNLTLLIWSLLATIISSFYFSYVSNDAPNFRFFLYANICIMILFYLSIAFIFIRKIRRSFRLSKSLKDKHGT